MLRSILTWTMTVVVGVALGVAATWTALELGRSTFLDRYGPWLHSRAAGAQAADPYTRAIVAKEGLLALSASEALYFTLQSDERGRPLDEGCLYDITSPPLAARWWSLTLYAHDGFLVRGGDNTPSLDASRALIAPDGSWRVRISPIRGEAANWVSSRNAGRNFSLTLRVYNPQRDFQRSAQALPAILTVSCAGDAT